MKISKSPMLVSSVMEKCIKMLFFPHRAGNFGRIFLSRHAYQGASMFLKSEKTIVLKNCAVLQSKKNNDDIILRASEAIKENFWQSYSEQKAKRDKNRAKKTKKQKKKNYNILLRASEEIFWLSYCRFKQKL